jgi:BirA family biotin operon repressor/biotin-[acetyl-CoA-carboxylase] ligase
MQTHIHLHTVDSTNCYLRQLIENTSIPLPNFFAVTADEQTAGRGRQGRVWESGSGQNLLMSILYNSPWTVKEQFFISQTVSLAITQLLQDVFKISYVKIKYPNDIYVGDKKICGMLIEHSVQGDVLKNSIIGIGLNLNQTVFPDHLPNPTSVMLEKGISANIFDCMKRIMDNIRCISQSDRVFIRDAYHRQLYRRDEFSTFVLHAEDKRLVKAKITGVSHEGLLTVCDSYGRIFHWNHTEVSMLSCLPPARK